MKISEIVKQDKLSLSFEVFPPKNTDTFDSVKSAIENIATLSPSFLSITYGAGGGTGKYTLEMAKNVLSKTSVPTLAHLTCVASTREGVKARLKEFSDAGIENILALRGDIPQNMINDDRSGWEYSHGDELVTDIKKSGYGFCVGGACYPEVHPESRNSVEDIKNLKRKVDAGCEFLTTQMFFDNTLFYSFLYNARNAGINVPVIAGIMPIITKKQIDRAVKLSGSFLPRKFLALVDKFGDNDKVMKQAGIAYATDQIIDLYANGINNIHIYTMNNYDVARSIKANVQSFLD